MRLLSAVLALVYRPRAAILDGSWKFPDPRPVN
jgi:hypothetical protein